MTTFIMMQHMCRPQIWHSAWILQQTLLFFVFQVSPITICNESILNWTAQDLLSRVKLWVPLIRLQTYYKQQQQYIVIKGHNMLNTYVRIQTGMIWPSITIEAGPNLIATPFRPGVVMINY